MDEVYIKRVIEGDIEAFRFLIREYQHMAFTVAMSVVKDEFIAEDVAQEAFIKAFENIKKFRFQSKFSTWLYRIVVNLAFKQLRKIKLKDGDFITVENESTESSPDGFDRLSETDRKHYINEALKLLSPKEALALRLFYLDENSIEEIVNITGWSAANVKVILHRARRNFHTALDRVLKHEMKTIL
ncbi:MAG: sigma-70 family RNA polymerase sigma factor [Chlorobi bacterium]|nr:sigma-70 family RNA polymerase sigma factor [Chlorobiota bacterium]